MKRFAPAMMGLAALLSGCDLVWGCEEVSCTLELVYAASVTVTGTGAAPEASLVMTAGPGVTPGEVVECWGMAGTATCAFGASAGEYVFDVQAPGYRTLEGVRLEVKPAHLRACCDPDYVPAHLDLALEPR